MPRPRTRSSRRARTTPGIPAIPATPPPPKPEPPVDGDPALAPGFECRLPGDSLNGAANEYGLIRLRVAPSEGSPVEIVPEAYDPAHEGAPGNVFSGGAFEDLYGNSFDFGFFTGTDPDPDPQWGGADLEPLAQWDPALSGLALGDVTVQIRLVVPDGRYSPWTTIDTGVEC